MSIIQGTSKSSAAGYTIDQSIRFNDDDSAYLSDTLGTATDTDVYTISLWVKRGNLGLLNYIFSAGPVSTTTEDFIGFQSNDTIFVRWAGTTRLVTTQVFRDPSSWYHIVLACDYAAAGSAKAKLYINGTEVTSFTTDTRSSITTTNQRWNTATLHYFGRNAPAGGQYLDGYLSEINFIDGQQLDPTSFGEYDSVTGVWIPRPYSGSYGTNGFYITGENSADLGADYSGNGNNFTSSGLTTADQVTDTPTDNYATINPLTASNTSMSFHEANLKVEMNAAYPGVVLGSIGVSTGKYYWEVTLSGTGSSANGYATGVAVAGWANKNSDPGGTATPYHHHIDSRAVYYDNNVSGSSGVNFTAGDIIGIALNCDDGEISYYKNNTLIVTRATLESGETWFPLFKNSTGVADLRYSPDFGQLGYTYTPPTNFLPLSAASLPEPTIKDGSAHFQTSLWSGNSSTQEINQTGNSTFQPDLVWFKSRSTTYNHQLQDAIRGVGNALFSNLTNAEGSYPSTITSLDADGFTLGSDAGANQSGQTYVGWQWLAGNGTASNTDGSITSTVSASTSMSIISYQGNGTAGATVGHGLGVKPSMLICKNRQGTEQWIVYQADQGATKYGLLNSTAAFASSSGAWNNTEPTSSVVTLGGGGFGTNVSSNNMIMYAFAEVDGFSKFGTYTGNGSADGPFVWCGFRPAFVIVKEYTSADDWVMYDSTRDPYNVAGRVLRCDSSAAEFDGRGGSRDVDFLSNGFKFRSSNATMNGSGSGYIFMAFAENPFKYSLAR